MTRPPNESFDDLPLKDLRRVVATLVAEVGRLREAESVKDDNGKRGENVGTLYIIKC